MTILSVINQKGGCGKTTTAINLAATLAEQGNRVLLVDADPQGHASLGLGCQGSTLAGLFELLTRTAPQEECVQRQVLENLDLLPGSISLASLEHVLDDQLSQRQLLARELNRLAESYQFIIIDCPPSLGLISISAMIASDHIIVPVDMGLFALDGIYRLEDTLSLLSERHDLRVQYHILPTIVDERTRLGRQFMDKLLTSHGEHLLSSTIRQTVKLKECFLHGKPIGLFDRKCQATYDFRRLANEVLKLSQAQMPVWDADSHYRAVSGVHGQSAGIGL